MAMRDVLYARISEDDLGTERGVVRQLEDTRALSVARGGTVVAEFVDNDISASKGYLRPDYERVMAMVRAGQADRILVFHTSRLWRNRRERAEGIDVLKQAGVSVLAVKGPDLDMTSAAGRMMAGILGEFDTAESEIKAERVARAALQRAQEGRANGAVLYGWQRTYELDDRGRVVAFRDTEEPTQAAVVRDIVDRLLAGESLRAVTESLNAEGVPAPGTGQRRARRAKGQDDTGTKWNKTSVKKLAIRPANVGLRVHHRGRPDEALLPAAWPAIVQREAYDAVVALMAANTADRAAPVTRPGARVHLLSWGIGECGVCDGHLSVSLRGNVRYGQKKLLYCCAGPGCVGRDRDRVDAYIGSVVVERLSRSDAADLLHGDAEGVATSLKRAEAIRIRLRKAADDFIDEKITEDQLHRMTARLKAQLAQAEGQARAHRPHPHADLVSGVAGENAQRAWDELSVTQRRAVVSLLIESVRILPVRRRGPGFDPTTIDIVWRGQSRRKSPQGTAA